MSRIHYSFKSPAGNVAIAATRRYNFVSSQKLGEKDDLPKLQQVLRLHEQNDFYLKAPARWREMVSNQ